jgi:3-methyl-2-oxobutanoate hydroxymethyltransferase
MSTHADIKKWTLPALAAAKRDQRKLVMLTAYDYGFARVADANGVDLVLVGDSLGMVVQGRASTLPVTVQDVAGNTVTTSSATVAIAIGTNPGAGTLSGTVSLVASNGVATFSNLSINKVGTGYTLVASSTGLTSATSGAFNVTVGAAAKAAEVVKQAEAQAEAPRPADSGDAAKPEAVAK